MDIKTKLRTGRRPMPLYGEDKVRGLTCGYKDKAEDRQEAHATVW